ncbi:hypothetical protein [uncultured Robinsoniella sp.]|uniref:hypothetical protein n=1 Tax=uncultured Robinsoniella sp. TaxID=904190 RepID=UPI00374E7256
MKRVFGNLEIAFDIMYLVSAFIIGMVLLMASSSGLHTLAGIMALILVFGDSFHLIPRIQVIISKNEKVLRTALGRGKQITSVSMTVFYLFLWQIGLQISSIPVLPLWNYLIYAMAVLRVALCFLPANRWVEEKPPVKWGIYRNIPFFVIGIMVSILFFLNRNVILSIHYMWLAILLSFSFYLPVVLFTNRNPKIGMLMLPKTGCYLWIISMCLFL